MKKGNKLTTIFILLVIVLICLIGFLGIYSQKQSQMVNVVPEYQKGMDLKGARVLELKVDTTSKDIIKDKDGKIIESATEEEIAQNGYTKAAVPVNSSENLTTQNYDLAKKIIENRLIESKFSDYVIRQNHDNGNLTIELKEDAQTDTMVNLLSSIGKFQMIDSQTNELLMTNQEIKQAKVMYSNANTSGTVVYLAIDFNKEAKAKLEQISRDYVTTKDAEGNETEKKIKLVLDDETLIESSFDEPMTTGQIQLSIGSGSSNSTELKQYVAQAGMMASLLNTGTMPITYTVSTNKFIQAEAKTETMKVAVVAIIIIAVIATSYLIIRYRKNGLLATILLFGFTALYLLIIRLTNVELTVDGIFAIFLSILLYYLFMTRLLEKIKKETNVKRGMKQITKKIGFVLIPIYLLAVVFSFVSYAPMNTFGMNLFWGMTTIIFYHLIFSRTLLIAVNHKKEMEE